MEPGTAADCSGFPRHNPKLSVARFGETLTLQSALLSPLYSAVCVTVSILCCSLVCHLAALVVLYSLQPTGRPQAACVCAAYTVHAR